MRVSIAYILILISCSNSLSQSFTYFNYGTKEGLPSSEVYDIFQDKNGFLWFATDNGVVKYDGNEMKVFSSKDGLIDPVVFGFQEDLDGRIWFRSYSGKVSYYENQRIHSYPFNEKLLKYNTYGLLNFHYNSQLKKLSFVSSLTDASIDSSGHVHVNNTIDLYSYYYKKIEGKWLWRIVPSAKIKNLIIDHKEYSLEPLKQSHRFYNYSGYSYTLERQGVFYLTYSNVILSYDGENLKQVYSAAAPIISLSKDNNDRIWVGYLNSGVERFDDDSFSKPWTLPLLAKLSISKVFQDRNGGFWFSTLENGVYSLPNLSIENYEKVSESKITKVASKNDSVYISNQQGHVTLLNSTTKKNEWRKEFNSPITALYLDNQERLWISYSPTTHIYSKHGYLLNTVNTHANKFMEGDKGIIWGFGGQNILKFSSDGQRIVEKRLGSIYRTFIVDDSLIFLAGKIGLHIRNSNNFELLNSPKEFEDLKISNFHLLTDSILMINTSGNGIILLNKKTGAIKKFNASNQFIANNIYTIEKVDNNLLLGTEVGVIIMNETSLLEESPVFSSLNEKNGLLSNDIKFIAPTSENILAFADYGYSIIPKDQLQITRSTPQIYLKDISINDSLFFTINSITHTKLNHDKTNVTINIGYLSFTNQNVTSRYRLLKTDSWVYTKERSFQFSSLAPNHYEFELEYSVDNVEWTPSNITLAFTVLQPWWKRWYTLAGATILLLTLAYIYFRIQLKTYQQKTHFLGVINNQQQKLVQAEVQITERERKRIAKELHDGVGTDLTAVKMRVMSLLANLEDKRSVHDIEEQFQSTIKDLKGIAYGLTPPYLERYGLFVVLNNYFDRIKETSTIKIHYNSFWK